MIAVTPKMFGCPERSIQARRRHLQHIPARDRILHVENGAKLTANELAIVEVDTGLLIDVDAQQALTARVGL
jgi:hypothetical protein